MNKNMNTRISRRNSKNLRTTVSGLASTLFLLLGPLCSQAQQIGCGRTINSSIGFAGQTDTYTFTAKAGETVTILALGQSLNAVGDVYSPAETRIGSATNNFTGPLNLTTSGTYTIRVHADNSVATGAYGISLTFLTGRCGTPLIWGLPASNTVASLAEVDSYTFSGNAGETVVISASGSNFSAAAFVSGPTGTIFANWVNGTTTLHLAITGTYTVGIYSFYIGGAGSYSGSLTFTELTPASYRLAAATTNGAVVLTLWGQVGRMTALHYTGELPTNQWVALTNFNLPWSPYRFVDWSSTNSPRRFYRTVQ